MANAKIKTEMKGRRRTQDQVECRWFDELFTSESFGPMLGEVGHKGDIEELLEYPCNCYACQKEYNENNHSD